MTTNLQLKAHCENVIANPQGHLDWVVDMARVALARLEAEPVYQLIDDGNWWDAPKYLFDEAKERGEQHRVVYRAPPVPELKPIVLAKGALMISAYTTDPMNADPVLCLSKEGVIEAILAAGYEVKS